MEAMKYFGLALRRENPGCAWAADCDAQPANSVLAMKLWKTEELSDFHQ
jgi:hypothetical protein